MKTDSTEKSFLTFPDGSHLEIGGKPLVMGILNVTPDSFSDGGQYFEADRAVQHATQLLNEGADFIDIGGESTRPGAAPISEKEEIARVIPVIKKIAQLPGIRISIDTRNAGTARAALSEGACFVNDVSGGLHDLAMLPLIAEEAVPCCLMHMRGTPIDMIDHTAYSNVVDEVIDELQTRVVSALRCGIKRDKIILDPGIGFAKTPEQSYRLLNHLSSIAQIGYPVLVGASRKRLIAYADDVPPALRVGGSVALAVLAAERGASIIRVHDVAITRQALAVYHQFQRFAK